MNIPHPIGHYMLVERTINSKVGLVEIPDKYKKHVRSNATLLRIGNKCRPEFDLMDTLLIHNAPEGKELWKSEDETLEVIEESKVFAIKRGDIVIPLGKTVMIERMSNDLISKGGVLLPNRHTAQSLFGIFRCLGWHKKEKHKITGFEHLKFGDIIKLSKWHESHVELMINDVYYLIVKEEYVEGIWNESVQQTN